VKISAFCSTSTVRCLLLLGLWGLWAPRFCVVQEPTGLAAARADSGGLRDGTPLDRAAEAARPVEDGEAAVKILMDPHSGADVGAVVALWWNPEAAAGEGHAIVCPDNAILMNAQHVGERPAGIGSAAGTAKRAL
jgi:hypothetical protein